MSLQRRERTDVMVLEAGTAWACLLDIFLMVLRMGSAFRSGCEVQALWVKRFCEI